MYCLIVISVGSLSLLKQLLAQMFSTLARPTNCTLVKEYPRSTICPISSRGSKVTWISVHPGASFMWSLRNHSLCTMHIWGKKLHVWQSRVEIEHYCVFRPHYCVRNAVVQNFFKGGAHMPPLNLSTCNWSLPWNVGVVNSISTKGAGLPSMRTMRHYFPPEKALNFRPHPTR